MTMLRKTTTVAALAALGLLAGPGCYEDTDVTLYEPGEYKGARDPLLEKQRSEAQQQRLLERFDLVQRDR